MVLPFDQHSITFDDIIYSVDMPQVTQSHKYLKLKKFLVVAFKLILSQKQKLET